MSTSYWLDRTKPNERKSFDAIVVGAGITGMSIAYWLMKEDPSLKVAVIERQRVGYGATGRNAGFITCGSVEHFNRMIGKHGEQEALDIWRFSETNLKLLQEEIIEDKGLEIGFEKKGAYSLAAQEVEFKELQDVTKIMAKYNIQTETLNAGDIERRLGAVGFQGGIRYLDDASVHPIKLLGEIRKKTNATVFEGTEVFGYEDDGSGNRILKTDGGDFEAPMIIFALNGFTASLLPWFNDRIYPTRGQILMMEKVPSFMDGPCYANFYLDYFRQLPTGELLIGGFRQVEKATEVGYSEHTTAGIQSALHKFVIDHLPRYRDCKVTHRWGGIMGFSSDGQPMVGALPDDNQIFFCGGYTGHGMGMAFHAGKCTVDAIFGREIPRWISAKRF